MKEEIQERYGPFMTVEDLADLVKVNKQTIYNSLYDESLGIPHWRMGRRYLFPTDGVIAHIQMEMDKAGSLPEVQNG